MEIYYRYGSTLEWDVAARQAILQAVGGRIFKGHQEAESFIYNKESLLNGDFLRLGI